LCASARVLATNAFSAVKILPPAGELDNISRVATRMIGGMTAVVPRVPVLSRHDEIEMVLESIDQGYDFFPAGTARDPPITKSFCKSTMISAFITRN
jgi:hypothetical protein